MDGHPPADGSANEAVRGLVEHLFREQAGRLVSILVRHLGSRHVDLAEEVVQEALIAALQAWPFQGVPERPEAWLMRTARNRALDRLRRDRAFADRVPALTRALRDEEAGVQAIDRETALLRGHAGVHPAGSFDDEVCMLFMACHPDLPRDARLALTLKTVGGFGVAEIARAFLADERAIAQRLVRARQRIRDRALAFELPDRDDLAARLDSVLDVLYLIFNEGYTAHAGATLVRRDLCDTALRLGRQLTMHPVTALPKTHALLALMALQATRLPARGGEAAAEELFPLAEQDRSRWDRALLLEGFTHLDHARAGEELTAYHLQAGIASCHARAPTLDETDWPRVLWFYDRLAEAQPSSVVSIARRSRASAPSRSGDSSKRAWRRSKLRRRIDEGSSARTRVRRAATARLPGLGAVSLSARCRCLPAASGRRPSPAGLPTPNRGCARLRRGRR